MAQLFIGYSRDDLAVARSLAAALADAGHEVWWDLNALNAGDDFSEKIEAAIDTCDLAIILWSSSSIVSGFVRDEASHARDQKKIMPVSIDGAQPPLGFRNLHTLDAQDEVGPIVLSAVEKWHASRPKPKPDPAPLADETSEAEGDDFGAAFEKLDVEGMFQEAAFPKGIYRCGTAVRDIAISPDGRKLVAATIDKVAMVFDVVTGKVLQRLEGHDGVVTSVAVSPDGTQALTGCADMILRLWDLESGREIARFEGHEKAPWYAIFGREITGVSFFPDGRKAVSCSDDNTARIWDLERGHECAVLDGHDSTVSDVSVTQDGGRVITAGRDNVVRVWRTDIPQIEGQFAGHKGFVETIDLSPDGDRVASGSNDKTVKIWTIADGKELRSISHPNSLSSVAFSPDGTMLLTACWDKKTRLWNALTGALLHTAELTDHLSAHAIFAPDGTFAFVTTNNGVRRWHWD